MYVYMFEFAYLNTNHVVTKCVHLVGVLFGGIMKIQQFKINHCTVLYSALQ